LELTATHVHNINIVASGYLLAHSPASLTGWDGLRRVESDVAIPSTCSDPAPIGLPFRVADQAK
jgi:hypothetical protein